MNQELEDYMMMKMFAEKYGEETFEEAKGIWLIKNNYKKMKWYKKILIIWNLDTYGSKEYRELKKIQSKLIWELIDRKRKDKSLGEVL